VISWGGNAWTGGNGFQFTPVTGGENEGASGDAAHAPMTPFLIRPQDLAYAAQNGGVLNHALGFVAGTVGTVNGTSSPCPQPLPSPFLGSGDSHNFANCGAGYAPEGERGWLNMTDSQVNALGLGAITSVILRTIDKQHYGFFVVESAGAGGQNYRLWAENGQTYSAWGYPDPWIDSTFTTAGFTGSFLAECRSEGYSGCASGANTGNPNQTWQVPLPLPTSVGQNIMWCKMADAGACTP
jgi:hypothetical protein